MRKFGSNRKNPNPPWPSQQSVVMVPSGSNSAAIGLDDRKTYSDTSKPIESKQNNVSIQNNISEREVRREQLMGIMPQKNYSYIPKTNTDIGNSCGNISVTDYLCGQKGKYVKLEFLFGENMHMEKIGRLKGVGRDFVAIQENGTENTIVCATNKIKFINIYEFGI